MGHLLVSWLVAAVGLLVTAQIVPGFQVRGFKGALVVSALLGLLHWTVGPFLFAAIGFGTLLIGFLFAFVTWWIVTAILLKIVDALSDSLTVTSFGTALIASGVLSLLSTLKTYLFH